MATQTRRRNGKVPPTTAQKPAAPVEPETVAITPDQAVDRLTVQELQGQIGILSGEVARLRATVRVLQAQLAARDAAAVEEPAADVPA